MKKILSIIFLMLLTHGFLFGQPSNSSKELISSTIITSDIANFYNAFDQALLDTLHAEAIFKEQYLKKGTKGLDDFYSIKIKDAETFTGTVLRLKSFYQIIRPTLEQVQIHSDSIYSGFSKFKEMYPEAEFPDVYFVIGRHTSNGTASKNGLLIGAEVMSKTETNSKDWSEGLKKYTLNFDQVPVTVFHEMIHFNQKEMRKEKTLLKYAIIEGSAEFITELICGNTDGDYSSYKNREKAIWSDFKNEMDKNIYDDWLAEKEPSRPRNGMYWAGYWICRSYYDNASDKKQALYDILHVRDYKNFYLQSKVDDRMNNL